MKYLHSSIKYVNPAIKVFSLYYDAFVHEPLYEGPRYVTAVQYIITIKGKVKHR